MKFPRWTVFCLAAALGGSASVIAQEKKAKKAPVSPPAVATATLGGNEISIKYAQPGIKDPKTGQPRKIWGGLVPYGKVWRTGANAATTLTLSKPIVIGGFNLAAGKYTLFTVPLEGAGSKLIINKRTGQWGIPYKEAEEKANELARLDLTRAASKTNLERFTITIETTGPGAGRMVIRLGGCPVRDRFPQRRLMRAAGRVRTRRPRVGASSFSLPGAAAGGARRAGTGSGAARNVGAVRASHPAREPSNHRQIAAATRRRRPGFAGPTRRRGGGPARFAGLCQLGGGLPAGLRRLRAGGGGTDGLHEPVRMNALDWIVLLGSMLGIAAYGTWRTRHTDHLDTYLKGSRTTGWFTIGVSR
jgi:hypothetical protein